MTRVLIWPLDMTSGTESVSGLRSLGFNASANGSTMNSLAGNKQAIGVYMTRSPMNAISFLRDARGLGARNCILVLFDTTGGADAKARQRISALAAGADDAQHLPIDVRELAARITALTGREREYTEAPVPLPGGFYYRGNGALVGEHCTVLLTKTEHSVFDLLVERGGTLVTKSAVMQALYRGRDEPQEKIVDVFICKLRRKLLPICCELEVIETVWGQGYRFVPRGFRPERKEPLRLVGAAS